MNDHAQAQQEPESEARCLLLGPLAMSSYLSFVGEVAQKKRSTVGARADRATDLIELYERVGCDMVTLRTAIECISASILDPASRGPVAKRAETCMKDAGMPVR